MLILTRKLDQKILIGKDIVITIINIDSKSVRVGIDAPKEIPILRPEAKDKRSCKNTLT